MSNIRIPSPQEITAIWDKYSLPPYKQNHSEWVAKTAVWFATEMMANDLSRKVNIPLLHAAALLHDIDKLAPKKEGEHHPDAGVRILQELGYPEIADIVRTHPLHSILDQSIAPQSWEEKLLYLADKMVKHSVITVDRRFALWRAENLPERAVTILNRSYPLVKKLEAEVFHLIGHIPDEAAVLVK